MKQQISELSEEQKEFISSLISYFTLNARNRDKSMVYQKEPSNR